MAGQILQPEQPEVITHRCRANQRCVARTSDGSALTMGPDTLCHPCVDRLQDQLNQLPAIRDQLRDDFFVRGGSSAQTKVMFTSEAAAPLNVHVLDLIDEVDDVLDRTAGLTVYNLIRQPAMKFKMWHGAGWEMDYLDGVQRALEIARVWRKSDGVIRISRTWQQRLAKCPKCDLRTLGNFADEDTIHCSSCGGAMTRNEYSRICIITANKKKDT